MPDTKQQMSSRLEVHARYKLLSLLNGRASARMARYIDETKMATHVRSSLREPRFVSTNRTKLVRISLRAVSATSQKRYTAL